MFTILKRFKEFYRNINHLYRNEKNCNSKEQEMLLYIETRRQKSNLNRTILLAVFLIICSIASFGSPTVRTASGIWSSVLIVVSTLILVVYVEIADSFTKKKDEEYSDVKLRKRVRTAYMGFWAVYFLLISPVAKVFGENYNSSLIFWFAMIFVAMSVPVFIRIERYILIPFAAAGIILYLHWLNASFKIILIVVPVFFIVLLISQVNHFERLETYYESAKNVVESGANKRRLGKVFEEVFDLAFELDVGKNSCDVLRNCGEYEFVDVTEMSNTTFIRKIIEATYEDDRPLSEKNFNLDYLNNEFLLGRNQIYFEIRLNLKENEYKWVSVLLTREEAASENGNFFLCLIQDVEDRKKNENKLRLEAEKDPLTQLYNKVTTRSMIEECLEKNHTQQHALLIIDIDNFKTINDTRGHVIGDQILLAFAAELSKSFRETDILGRTGGDEFVVLIKNVQSIALVCDKLQRLTASFKKYGIDNGFPGRLSTSIGVAMYNKDGKTYEELFKKADAALYEAKRNGKDQYKFSISRS